MARYIDADKLCESLKNMAAVQEPYKQNTILGVVSSIENFPAADVVPKSEVENIFEEIGKILYRYDKQSERDGSEYGELIVGDIAMGIAELKKKYEEVK